MALNEPRNWLIAYDIADPRRLGRVHRYVSKQGVALQYSVFVLRMSTAALDALLADVDKLIDPREDDVRVYPLPADPHPIHLGRQVLPEGVILAEAGTKFEALPGLGGS